MAGEPPERLYYDGGCGLCHRVVRFVLAHDRDGRTFRFSPLGGETFTREVDAAAARALPDSLVVATRDGRLLTRSEGVIHIFVALGGVWRVLGAAGRIVPRIVRDFVYDRVATGRKRVFATPPEACPMVPADLRRRFDP